MHKINKDIWHSGESRQLTDEEVERILTGLKRLDAQIEEDEKYEPIPENFIDMIRGKVPFPKEGEWPPTH